jgi:LuxR family maltose regulon positive regulatory protein
LTTDISEHSPVAAKLARPRVGSVALRTDTIAAFRQATHRRLAVVCAPAGYGKTTVTAAALDALHAHDLWYKLDVQDQNPALFIGALTVVLRQWHPAFGEAILERLRAPADSHVPAEQLQAMFVRECEAHVGDPMTLVLDDYHEAAESPGLNSCLDYLLANLPATVRFVVLTRYDPAFSLSRLRLEDEVAVLDTDLLRFDEAMAAEVLAARFGGPPPPHHVRRLVDSTEGWPASIVLAGQALDWQDLDALETSLADPRLKQDIYSYLAEQVYRREQASVRVFLKRTCCLDYVTAELAATLTGSVEAHRHLRHLAANRVFTFATARSGAYRYHPLFRDYLQQKYVRDEGETAFRELQAVTAAALEKAGEHEMAIELFLGANRPVDALAVVARAGEAGLEALQSERLRSWVDRLTAGARDTEPWARLMLGQLHCRSGDYEPALEEITQAVALLQTATDQQSLYDALSMKECALFWCGDTAAAVVASREALAQARDDRQRAHSWLSLGSAALDMRDWEQAEEAFAAADALAIHATPADRIRARALRAHAAYYRGHFRAARSALPSTTRSDLPASVMTTLFNTRGLVELGMAHYPEALGLFQADLALAEQYDYALSADMVRDNIGLLLGAQGHTDEGLALVRRVMDNTAFAADETHAGFALCHEATLLRRSGEFDAATAPAEDAASRVSFDRDPYIALNSQANLLYLQGLVGAEVVAGLIALAERSHDTGLSFVAGKSRLYAALLLFSHDRGRESGTLLGECVPHQLVMGHRHLLAQELCPRPAAAVAALDLIPARGSQQALLDALATHWAFARFAQHLVAERPAFAAPAVHAARRGATTEVLEAVITVARATRSREVDRAVDTARTERPDLGEVPRSALDDLTKREAHILGLIAEGQDNRAIADELVLSLATVKTHVNHIFTKLGVHSRVQAILALKQSPAPSRQRR